MLEVMAWLREYDRKQVINAMANGAEVKAKEKVWTTEWDDVRFQKAGVKGLEFGEYVLPGVLQSGDASKSESVPHQQEQPGWQG